MESKELEQEIKNKVEPIQKMEILINNFTNDLLKLETELTEIEKKIKKINIINFIFFISLNILFLIMVSLLN